MHEITTSIEFQMSLLLFFALGGYLVAARIGQPAVVGQILLGLLVGPSVLGWITYTDFIASISHLGAIVLLFVVGMEFKLKDIARPSYAVIALFGVLVPWIGGYVVAINFGFETHRAILIGVALTATSIAITADTLRELGKLKDGPARAIIGAAVIDDVLALMALSAAEQIADSGIDMMSISLLLTKAVVFLAVGATVGQRILNRLMSGLDESALGQRYPDTTFVFAMMIAFVYAMVAELMGLSAIVGAFVAGVSLEAVQTKGSDFRHGAEKLRIVFGAIFFVSLGVLADLSIFTADIALFTALLAVTAFFTKVIGCGIPAKMAGMSTREALIVGVGMSPRGEVAMIIALLALNKGVIDQPAYLSLMLMSLFTTLIAPLILKNWLYKQEVP